MEVEGHSKSIALPPHLDQRSQSQPVKMFRRHVTPAPHAGIIWEVCVLSSHTEGQQRKLLVGFQEEEK